MSNTPDPTLPWLEKLVSVPGGVPVTQRAAIQHQLGELGVRWVEAAIRDTHDRARAALANFVLRTDFDRVVEDRARGVQLVVDIQALLEREQYQGALAIIGTRTSFRDTTMFPQIVESTEESPNV